MLMFFLRNVKTKAYLAPSLNQHFCLPTLVYVSMFYNIYIYISESKTEQLKIHDTE